MRTEREKSTGGFLAVGDTETDPDLLYLTGFLCPSPVVFLKAGRRRLLVVPRLEYGRALRQASRMSVLMPEMIGVECGRTGELERWVSALLSRERLRQVSVGDRFPVGLCRMIEADGIRVSVRPSPCVPARAVKQDDELREITVAQRAAVKAMRAARRLIAESWVRSDGCLQDGRGVLTSERVRRSMHSVLLERGCLARDTIVACGRQSADPHERGHGPLRAGQPIVIDVFPQIERSRYWGDLTRTFVKGMPESALRERYRVVREAHARALEHVRAGIRCETVHRSADRVFEQHGLRTGTRDGRPYGFIHSVGHGVGLEIHESPRVSLGPDRLRSGHVITIEPGYYDPRWGGIRVEDTVAVTREGYRLLCRCPYTFVLN